MVFSTNCVHGVNIQDRRNIILNIGYTVAIRLQVICLTLFQLNVFAKLKIFHNVPIFGSMTIFVYIG